MSIKSFVIITMWISCLSYADVDRVIYGKDNRVEPYQKREWYKTSQAVAAMVENNALIEKSSKTYGFASRPLREAFRLCEGERFNDQPVLARCTGFLISPDTLMTAGHCIKSEFDCQNFSWVFGYEYKSKKSKNIVIKKKDVFKCSSIVSRSYGRTVPDYAIIKLSRRSKRTPLKLQDPEAPILEGQEVVMMGYPLGLPLKITDDAKVLGFDRHFFLTNLDAFHVNSGSPVINAETSEVLGVLVKGKPDFKNQEGCSVANVLDETLGGEKATSIKHISFPDHI